MPIRRRLLLEVLVLGGLRNQTWKEWLFVGVLIFGLGKRELQMGLLVVELEAVVGSLLLFVAVRGAKGVEVEVWWTERLDARRNQMLRRRCNLASRVEVV